MCGREPLKILSDMVSYHFKIFKGCLPYLRSISIKFPQFNQLLREYSHYYNPSQPGVAYLYPLKTSENLKVF